jgi:hypothetical protein
MEIIAVHSEKHTKLINKNDIDSVQNWCFENGMILNVGKNYYHILYAQNC